MSIGDSDFGVQVGIGVLGRVAKMIVAFLGSIYLARELGATGYGLYALFATIANVADNPVTGWARACKKRFTEIDFPSSEAVGSLIFGIAISTIFMLVGSYFLSDHIDLLSAQPWGWVLLTLLFTGTASFRSLLTLLNGTDRFGSSSWIATIRDICRVPAQVVLVTAGLGVAGMILGMALASLLMCPVIGYLIRIRPAIPSEKSVRDIWSFAKSTIPNGFLGTAKGRMDIILLGMLADAAVVGNYEIAMRLTMPAIIISSVASGALDGRVSNLESRNEEFIQDIQNNLAYTSLLAIPMVVGAFTIGETLVTTLYGSDFALAGTFIMMMSIYWFFSSQKKTLRATVMGLDRPDLALYESLATFGTNIILGISLFFVLGPIGVIVATALSELFGYVIDAYFVRRSLPSMTLLPQPIIHQIESALLMGGGVYGLQILLSSNGWVVTLAIVGVGAAIYFLSLMILSEPFRVTVFGIINDTRFSL